MNAQDLENIERAFEKAKRSPQAMADWANEHAVSLFTAVRDGLPMLPELIASDDPRCDAPASLASDAELNNSTDGAFWAEQFAIRVRATPALATDRGFLIGWFANAIENGKRNGGGDKPSTFTTEDALDASEAIGELVDALRPFAALGAPNCVALMEAAAEQLNGALDKSEAFVSITDSEGAEVASVSLEDCERAYRLVQEADGATA